MIIKLVSRTTILLSTFFLLFGCKNSQVNSYKDCSSTKTNNSFKSLNFAGGYCDYINYLKINQKINLDQIDPKLIEESSVKLHSKSFCESINNYKKELNQSNEDNLVVLFSQSLDNLDKKLQKPSPPYISILIANYAVNQSCSQHKDDWNTFINGFDNKSFFDADFFRLTINKEQFVSKYQTYLTEATNKGITILPPTFFVQEGPKVCNEIEVYGIDGFLTNISAQLSAIKDKNFKKSSIFNTGFSIQLFCNYRLKQFQESMKKHNTSPNRQPIDIPLEQI